jgi:hypothetical protein
VNESAVRPDDDPLMNLRSSQASTNAVADAVAAVRPVATIMVCGFGLGADIILAIDPAGWSSGHTHPAARP